MRFIFSFLALTAWFFPKLRGKRAQGKQPVRENNRDLPQPIRNLAFLTWPTVFMTFETSLFSLA